MKATLNYLFPLKGSLMSSRYDIFRKSNRHLNKIIVDNAIIIPPLVNNSNDCCVIDSHGNIVQNSFHESENVFLNSISKSIPIPTRKITGKVLFAGYFNSHWGHFITDTISRLWPLFRDQCEDFEKIIFCVHEWEKNSICGNVQRLLSLLDLVDKIELISEPIKCDEVIVPDFAVYPREIFSEDTKCIYDMIVNKAMHIKSSQVCGPKIYMSRSKLTKAYTNEAGLKMIDQWMIVNGFDIIYPERMDIVDLIHALQGAEEVAAISGTLPHNMLFGRDGARLIIIEKYPTINNYQQGIDLLRNLNVTIIDAGAFIRPVDPGLGPFILYPTSQLMAYANDNRMIPPCTMSTSNIRKDLRLFFRMFKKNYFEKWILPDWLIEEVLLCCEAYDETEKVFGPWLEGLNYIKLRNSINPRRIVRKLLRYLRNK